MTQTALIINSPYDKPQQHWAQDERGRVLEVVPGRNQYEIRWPNVVRIETMAHEGQGRPKNIGLMD